MKITVFISEESIQYNMIPETDHERDFLRGLSKYEGEVSVHQAADIATCRNGYMRHFGDKGEYATAIRIAKTKTKNNDK